ncbi:MAG: hypothetical protein Q3971_01955 [Moraxella sp.]|nr:hypothetical protein [Moraxella sp.]
MFKNLRILILLCIFLIVAVNNFRDKNHDWQKPIYVALYPINVDNSPEVAKYIASLSDKDFKEIGSYLNGESKKYGKNVHFYYLLGQEVKVMPPPVPKSGGVIDVMIWSLKFRYYAHKNAHDVGVPTNLRLFLQYHSLNKKVLTETSTALQNGRIGVVNLFGTPAKTANNNVVIAHESLHAFGASDKYDLSNGIPMYPHGYANPTQNPRYPQTHAELMAVHIPTSPTKFDMARDLTQTVVGEMTAMEMKWKKLD